MTSFDDQFRAEFVNRPWGYFQVLDSGADYKVKLLVIQPGHRLSLQRHRWRTEHWHIARGTAEVTLHAESFTLEPGESVDIPALAWHRLSNGGDRALVLVEVQRGSRLEESDIERKADDYGRLD